MISPLKKKLRKALQLKKSHLVIVGLALSISISLMSAQRILNTSIELLLTNKSAELLTGDIEIASTQALSPENRQLIGNTLPQHQTTNRQIFTSMIQFYGNQTKLVEIVAIESNYPLRGNCTATDNDGNIVPITTLLNTQPSAIVISQQLMLNTDITFGSTVSIGEFKGTVVGVVNQEPDISIQSLSLGPRLYMHLTNVPATGFDQVLSRNYHSLFIAFDQSSTSDFWVEPLATALGIQGNQKTIQGSYGPSQPIIVRSFRDMNEALLRGFSSVNQFFLILSLFILLLSGTAFGFIIWTSILQKLADIGNLRYLGITIRQVHQFYTYEAIRIAIIATILGFFNGALIAQLCQWLIAKQWNLPIDWVTIHPMDACFIAGFSILGIYLMTICVMTLTKTNGVFNNEQTQKINMKVLGMIAGVLLGFMAIFLIMNGVNTKQAIILIGVFLMVFVCLSIIDRIVEVILKKIPTKKISLPTRIAIKYLSDGHTLRRMAFISICFSLIGIFTMAHYEASLNNEFNPKNSTNVLPSLFVTDLYGHQMNAFKSLVTNRHTLSPLARTRIIAINHQPLPSYVTDRKISETTFLYREQNLSSRSTMYPTETLVQGQWFDPDNPLIELSVEERFAKRLKLKLNDTLEFSIFGIPFLTTITSIRSVDWSTFDPNFFLLIEPPHLTQFPQTWVSAIYTNDDAETLATQTQLAETFPNATIIDIQRTSQKVLGFFKTFIAAFKMGALFSFFIGGCLFLLLGKLYVDIRKDSYNMLHWIGMSKTSIQTTSLIENMIFASITYLTALIISLGIASILFSFFVPIPLKINGSVMVGTAFVLLGMVSIEWRLKS